MRQNAGLRLSRLGRARRFELALKLLTVVRVEKLEPNVFHYSAAMSACEKS